MKKTPTVQQPSYLRKAVAYVEYWVPRLRLENYEILVVAAGEDFEHFAQATMDPSSLRASITVQDPKKMGSALVCSDLEVTVAHELIHIRFGEVVKELDGKLHYANEVATEMLAMALVAARRGVNPRSLYGL